MFDKIQQSLWSGLPLWAEASADYKRLLALQAVIEAKQYEKIITPFWQEETQGGGDYIPIVNRRPNVTVNIAKGLTRKVARKMFAGRQRPTLYNEDQDAVQNVEALLREGFFEQNLVRVAQWASIGAAAMTFSILKDGSDTPRIVFCAHRATECLPTFDALGELKELRIQYICQGVHFLRQGYRRDSAGEEITPTGRYWYACDYTRNEVVCYVPTQENHYSPFSWPQFPEGAPQGLRRDEGDGAVCQPQKHDLGFVPGHWFCSMSQGCLPWGGCYWELGMDTATTMDYTASQLVHSLWYAGHPDLVVKGKVLNALNGRIIRDASKVIHFASDRADAAQNRIGGGDAKLLETNGAGFAETREAIELLRKLFLEQCQGSRKDPDRMKAVAMSGAAMYAMDEDLVDLMQELRTDHGEQGALVITKKAARAAKKMGHPLAEGFSEKIIGSLAYEWPPPFGLGAGEILQLTQAMTMAVTPGGGMAGGGGGGGEGEGAGPKPPDVEPLLTHEEARAVMLTDLNIPQLSRAPSRQQDPQE